MATEPKNFRTDFTAAILLYLSSVERKNFRKLKKTQLSILSRVVNFPIGRMQLSAKSLSQGRLCPVNFPWVARPPPVPKTIDRCIKLVHTQIKFYLTVTLFHAQAIDP